MITSGIWIKHTWQLQHLILIILQLFTYMNKLCRLLPRLLIYLIFLQEFCADNPNVTCEKIMEKQWITGSHMNNRNSQCNFSETILIVECFFTSCTWSERLSVCMLWEALQCYIFVVLTITATGSFVAKFLFHWQIKYDVLHDSCIWYEVLSQLQDLVGQ